MSRGLVQLTFPNAPTEYSQRQMSEILRTFSVFLQQIQNPGPWEASTLTLTNLQTDDYGLAEGEVFQQNGFLKIALLNQPNPRGVSSTGGVGSVTVVTP
jgi:hypothetical protein